MGHFSCLPRRLFTLAVLAALSTVATAASIPYETSGIFDLRGVSNDHAIGYMPAQIFGPTLFGGTPGILQLGPFMAQPLYNPGPYDPSLPQPTYIYQHDPFTIDVTFRDLPHGAGLGDGVAVMRITGELNGALTGPDTSTVVAKFNSVSKLPGDVALPFDLSSLHILGPISLVASSGYSPGGATSG